MVTFQWLIGIIAVIITPFSTIPQLYKTIKTKNVGTISFNSFWILWSGSIAWILYSVYKTEVSPILLTASVIDLFLLSSLIFLFYKYSNHKLFKVVIGILSTGILAIFVLATLALSNVFKINNFYLNSVLINFASFCISFASLPQIIKTIYLNKIKGLSLFYKSLVLGVEVSWFSYWLIAGLLTIYNIQGGVSVPVEEMIQLLVWASFAVVINLILVLLIIFKDTIPTLKQKRANKH
ncbi:SemiSWEET family transporter [Mycoplasma procyoni]|uniref:SemiSWEET family transporter n=1 Tax=Mycoplasma procyoni TaxID=568784 RepID=UPI00197C2B23|nr:SemiSWEET family transporter [Mycoplasma procyoni]MBN3534771.1 hypothetical protein [Mycoplasma procyoni]